MWLAAGQLEINPAIGTQIPASVFSMHLNSHQPIRDRTPTGTKRSETKTARLVNVAMRM